MLQIEYNNDQGTIRIERTGRDEEGAEKKSTKRSLSSVWHEDGQSQTPRKEPNNSEETYHKPDAEDAEQVQADES